MRTQPGPVDEAARLLEGLKHLDPVECEGQNAKVPEQLAPCGQLIVGKVGDLLVGFATFLGTAQIQDHERGMYQEEVFDRVEAFLAAVEILLLSRIKGPRDGSFGAVVGKGG